MFGIYFKILFLIRSIIIRKIMTKQKKKFIGKINFFEFNVVYRLKQPYTYLCK